jgi:hypothetical protein
MSIDWYMSLVIGAIGFLAYWLGLLNRQYNGLVDALDERFLVITAALREIGGHYATREVLYQRAETLHRAVAQLDDMDTSVVKALTRLETDLRVLKRELRQPHSQSAIYFRFPLLASSYGRSESPSSRTFAAMKRGTALLVFGGPLMKPFRFGERI